MWCRVALANLSYNTGSKDSLLKIKWTIKSLFTCSSMSFFFDFSTKFKAVSAAQKSWNDFSHTIVQGHFFFKMRKSIGDSPNVRSELRSPHKCLYETVIIVFNSSGQPPFFWPLYFAHYKFNSNNLYIDVLNTLVNLCQNFSMDKIQFPPPKRRPQIYCFKIMKFKNKSVLDTFIHLSV